MMDSTYHQREAEIQVRDNHLNGIIADFGFSEATAVLDIGCGAGQTLRLIRHPDTLLCGLDINWDALCEGATLNTGDSCICFVSGAGGKLPFADNTFSHLICRVSLNYMKPSEVLSEIARVTSAGGVIYLRVEGLGFDFKLVRDAKTPRAFVSRLYDLLCGLLFNSTGYLPNLRGLPRVGRIFLSRYRLNRELNRRGADCVYWRTVNRRLAFAPTAIEVVAQKTRT